MKTLKEKIQLYKNKDCKESLYWVAGYSFAMNYIKNCNTQRSGFINLDRNAKTLTTDCRSYSEGLGCALMDIADNIENEGYADYCVIYINSKIK